LRLLLNLHWEKNKSPNKKPVAGIF